MSIEHSPAKTGVRILRRKQVLERLNVSPTTLWQWVRDGQFPAPFDLDPNTKTWLEADVDRHLEHQARKVTPAPLRRTRG